MRVSNVDSLRAVLISAILLLDAAPARSVPLPPLPPPPPIPACMTQTLDNYINLGMTGCAIDDKIFAGFSYTPPNGVNPTARQITVTPITTPLNPGFTFTADPEWEVNGADASYLLTYHVFVRGAAIKDASLLLRGEFTVNQASIGVLENLCLEGIFDATGACFFGTFDFLLATFPGGNIGEDATTFRPPVFFIDVATELMLSAGNASSAVLPSFREQFSEVPAPSSMLLLSVGLAGALRWLKRSGRRFRSQDVRGDRPTSD